MVCCSDENLGILNRQIAVDTIDGSDTSDTPVCLGDLPVDWSFFLSVHDLPVEQTCLLSVQSAFAHSLETH